MPTPPKHVASVLSWDSHRHEETTHRGVATDGTIEIVDTGDTVYCGRSDRTWPLLHWKVVGDGFHVEGTARSLGRAKEDALAALGLLSVHDFETSTPREEERV